MKLLDNTSNIKRINEIVRVLAKHGFDTIAQILTEKNINVIRRKAANPDIPSDPYVRIRLVLQELGTTFIKLGQTLSTYPDLVGYELANELSKLQESAPVNSYSQVEEVILEELSTPVDDLFDDFTMQPIASASVGQVHKAYLNDKEVAVKVQHPGIKDTIDSDISIMKYIATHLESAFDQLKSYNLPGIVEVFEHDIYNELDYHFEANNAIHLRENLKSSEVYVPEIYTEYSTDKVLVMEYLEGVSLNTVLASSDDKYDKPKIARVGADSYIKQILIHGFFHADPHPGNIFVLNNDILAFIDFGMMGHLDDQLREDICKLFIFISTGDANLLTKQLYYMDILTDSSYMKDVETDIIDILDKYYGTQFNDITGVIREIVSSDLLNKYDVVIPRDLMMVIRTLSMIDDLGTELDPTFNTTEIVEPYVKDMLLDMVKPKQLFRKTSESYLDTSYIFKKLPQSLLNFFNIVDDGRIGINLSLNDEKLTGFIGIIVNRIVLAIIIAALLIGSSFIMIIDTGYTLLGYPILGFIGFTFSAILGAVLIINIIRTGDY
ncbi:MAG: AarF/ABC1/UbiB kinase family protein [Methanosphaera sp.]|nr:AarF/ABC1/UbiB kinase family protein [Methanosphaera sp.]